MSQPFKIFRLPSVALDVVLNEFAIVEIFNLSNCSKRSHSAMKQFTRRRVYIFLLHLGYAYKNYTISVTDRWEDREFKKEIHYCIHKKEDGDQVLREDLRLEIFKLLDLFRPTTSLAIYVNCALEPLVSMVTLLNLNLADVFISVYVRPNFELYKVSLSVFKNSTKLQFYATPPQTFKLENVPEFTCEKIDIFSASWVTVDNIVNGFMDCKTVILRDCAILANTIYPIIRKWLDSRSGLEKMNLMLRGKGGSIPIGDILRDIPYREVDGKYVIRREDGIEAKIRCSKTQFKMVIS